MICIRITRREDGLDLFAHGHAGYAPRGQDVVCAGVSALLYGFIAYLEGLVPIATAETSEGGTSCLRVQDKDGILSVKIRGMSEADLEGLKVIQAGLGLMAAAYPAYVMLDTNIHREGDEHDSN